MIINNNPSHNTNRQNHKNILFTSLFIFILLMALTVLTYIPYAEATEIISSSPGDNTRPFNQYTELTTHNAFTNYDDAGWAVVNQGTKGIQNQLDGGVRGIMLDAYWFGGSTTFTCDISFGSDCYDSGVYLCHGGCSGFPGSTYALPRQTLSDTMKIIVNFLYQHPDEIVTVFIEDYTSDNQLQDALDSVYGLDPLTFSLTKTDLETHGWPTKQWLIDNNNRLLIMTDRDNYSGGLYDSANPVYSDKAILLESEFGHAGNDKCEPRHDTTVPRYANGIDMTHPNNLYWLLLVNHFPDIPELITAENDNDYDVLGEKINNHCVPDAGQYPNYVAVDFFYASRDDIDTVLGEAELDWNTKWVTFNSAPPTASIVINYGNTDAPSRFVTLTTTFVDEFGVKECRYSNEDNVWSSWEPCKQYKTWVLSDGDKEVKTVNYEIKDYFGNTSAVSDTIYFDKDLPHQDFHFIINATGTETNTYDVTFDINSFYIDDNSESIFLGSNGEFHFDLEVYVDDALYESARLPTSSGAHYSWDEGFHSKYHNLLNSVELSTGSSLYLTIDGTEVDDGANNDDNVGTSKSIITHSIPSDGIFATESTGYYSASYEILNSPNPTPWVTTENGISSVDYTDNSLAPQPKHTSLVFAPNGDTVWTQSDDNPAVTCLMDQNTLKCKTINSTPQMVFVTLSPVDMKITDPLNRIISKTVNEIPGAVYREIDLDGDGNLDDQIIIDDRIDGNSEYKIEVIPEPGADLNDVYSLGVLIEGKAGILADEVQLKDIPTSYLVDDSEEGFNIPPVANTGGTYYGYEGSPILLDANKLSYDSDGDIILYEWDLDDDGTYELSTTIPMNYTWVDDFDGIINLKVTDDDNLTDKDSTSVIIYNIPPLVEINTQDDYVLVGSTINFNGSFTDVGIFDTHTTLWNFDDYNNNQTATALDTTHIYYNSGIYYPTFTVTDDDEGLGLESAPLVVITLIQALQTINADIQEIIDVNPESELDDKLEDCIGSIEIAIIELEKLPQDNQAAAGNIEGITGCLEDAIKDNDLDSVIGEQIINEILDVSRQIAVNTIYTANNTQGSDPDKINSANIALSNGDTLRILPISFGDPKSAAASYKVAAAEAESAMP